jgi:hypothetical protein
LQKQVQLLDDFTSSVDLFLKPEDALKFKYNTLAYKVSGIGFGDVTGEQLAKVEPSKIREFVNAMMQSSDVSVEAKSDILNYARQLLELNNDLDSFAENISSVKEEYQSNTDYALELLQKSIEKEKELAETSLESHEKSVDSLKSIFDMLEEYIRDLLKQVESTSKNAAIKGRELISKAITTGILPAEKDLKKAIDDVKSNVESTKYKDKFQADRARLLLAIDLKKLQDLTGEQLTDAEKQLSATKDQIKQYDTMLRKYQDQIDIMRGTYSATLKVVDAITLLEAAITSELSKTKQLQSQAILGSNGAVFNTKTLEGKNAKGAGFNSEQLLRDAIKHLESGGSPQSVLDAIASSGFTFGQAETILGLPSGTLNDYAALNSWVKSTISSGKLNPSDLSGSTISPTQTIVTNSGAMYDPTTNIGVNTQGVAWNVSDVAAEAQRMISAGMVSDVVAAIQSQGFSVSQAEKILGINIPEYATGINYVPSDRLAMIHKGEAVVPARFNPSVFASNSESDDEDMQNLRAEVRAVVTHVSKLSRNIDRLIVPTTSGEALQTKAVV